MKKGKVALFIFSLILAFVSCNKDDEGDDFVEVEIRDRAEQQLTDNDSIIGYLETHYYNSDAINALKPNVSISDIIITQLADGETDAPAGHTLLKKGDDLAVEKHSIVFSNTDYEFYILKINEGGGDSPSFADEVRVRYEGFELDGDIFDSAVTPVDFDLVALVPGWRKALPQFSASSSFEIGGDGLVNYTNHGVGVMFLPSGLGYFSTGSAGIGAYSPLIFKFDLLQKLKEGDHDGDGIPSYLEDLNGDGEFTIANPEDETVTHDDTDGDFIPNYFDNDDDNDGVLTIDEIKNEFVIKTYNESTKSDIENLSLVTNEVLVNIKKESDGTFTGTTITSTDTDGDGIHDYLDAD